MSPIFYIHAQTPDGSTITAFIPGEKPETIDNSHPNFDAIVAGLTSDPQDESVAKLFNVAPQIEAVFKKVSDRIAIKDGLVWMDGDVVDNACTQQIVRFLNEGVAEEQWMALVNFMEKVASNPNEHSREQLYTWLARRDFTITANGDFIGYKGVGMDLRSISSGPGIVNGVTTSGRLDNTPGNVIEIARSYVQHDPSVGCHTGLHVGDFSYANSFGQRTLKVTVNPRDVVSVPTDCDWRKVRCCRYEVIEEIEKPLTSALDWSTIPDEEDDFWDDEAQEIHAEDEPEPEYEDGDYVEGEGYFCSICSTPGDPVFH